MRIKPGWMDFFWMAVGGALLLAIMLIVLLFHDQNDPAKLLALKGKRLERVERMRLALSTASEAEKSAVMAVTDESSKAFADQARESLVVVDRLREELEKHFEVTGLRSEQELLAQFTKAFGELRSVDDELLNLAVRNSNLKAYRLAFGPAAEAMAAMDAALSRIVKEAASSESPDARRVLLLASSAQSAALRLQALLAPHIAEESDAKMDALEDSMAREDHEVRERLEALPPLLKSGSSDVEAATSSYTRFAETRREILKLSRENTNVRSLTISLDRKRKVMSMCQDALAALEQAVQDEAIPGITYAAPVNPR